MKKSSLIVILVVLCCSCLSSIGMATMGRRGGGRVRHKRSVKVESVRERQRPVKAAKIETRTQKTKRGAFLKMYKTKDCSGDAPLRVINLNPGIKKSIKGKIKTPRGQHVCCMKSKNMKINGTYSHPFDARKIKQPMSAGCSGAGCSREQKVSLNSPDWKDPRTRRFRRFGEHTTVYSNAEDCAKDISLEFSPVE